MKNNKTLKIILPIVIVAVLVGMYFIKNSDSKDTISNSKVESTNIAGESGSKSELLETEVPNFEEYAKKKLPVIVDYGSDTCEPCRMMEPHYKAFHEKMEGKAIVKYVDIDLNRDAAKEVPIQVIPTQVLFNADGTPYVPSDEIKEKIPFEMYNHKVTKKHIYTIHQGFLNEEQLLEIAKDMGVKE
ncbi:thioredoxin family protein [Lagierella sp.]|uniref:thioredoxin family protein n=1 Tax=Lagierella sp. TaxID=2849657 RepID=UPI002612B797|nr:thioredoxin family protein [Lagierella sp.]